jgi:hypothetical protein
VEPAGACSKFSRCLALGLLVKAANNRPRGNLGPCAEVNVYGMWEVHTLHVVAMSIYLDPSSVAPANRKPKRHPKHVVWLLYL